MPAEVVRHAIYPLILQSVIDLIEVINSEELAFVHKPEYQRLYNILMVCAINDRKKSRDVCRLIAKGFNRIMKGPFDDYFEELGLPEDWHESTDALSVTQAKFEEHEEQFEATLDELKWEWFSELEEDCDLATVARGYYVALVDVTACQAEEGQLRIDHLEKKR